MLIVHSVTFLLALVGIAILTMLGTNYVVGGQGLHPALCTLGVIALTSAGVFALVRAERLGTE